MLCLLMKMTEIEKVLIIKNHFSIGKKRFLLLKLSFFLNNIGDGDGPIQ